MTLRYNTLYCFLVRLLLLVPFFFHVTCHFVVTTVYVSRENE